MEIAEDFIGPFGALAFTPDDTLVSYKSFDIIVPHSIIISISLTVNSNGPSTVSVEVLQFDGRPNSITGPTT